VIDRRGVFDAKKISCKKGIYSEMFASPKANKIEFEWNSDELGFETLGQDTIIF
jgi:hypothetical protein